MLNNTVFGFDNGIFKNSNTSIMNCRSCGGWMTYVAGVDVLVAQRDFMMRREMSCRPKAASEVVVTLMRNELQILRWQDDVRRRG